MDLSRLRWIKNVKHQGKDKRWAYDKVLEDKIFRLNWRNSSQKDNAHKPLKGDLIALVQLGRVTHIVEILDDPVDKDTEAEWGIYRLVKAFWMPAEGFVWQKENFPRQ